MKRLLLCLSVIVCLLSASNVAAQHRVYVTITDGIENEQVKAVMERNLTRMLTEINAAQKADRDLNFETMNIKSDRVRKSMTMLWENTPFMCTDDEIVEHCVRTGSGYQIRNIPLMMKPTETRAFNEEEYQEAVVSFDRQGNVESFYLAIANNLYMNVVKSNLELTDLRRRQMILDYVEQFRTAYNQKDINFLEQIYSDDALIITGRVIMQRKMENDKVVYSQKIQYNKQSKQRYIQGLRRIFQNARYFRVIFDNIEVMRHPTNPNFYGVTLHQGWTNNSYHDEGYLFLLWDFTDEYAPQIHVRTWQPDQLGNRPINKDEIFTLSDFDIH